MFKEIFSICLFLCFDVFASGCTAPNREQEEILSQVWDMVKVDESVNMENTAKIATRSLIIHELEIPCNDDDYAYLSNKAILEKKGVWHEDDMHKRVRMELERIKEKFTGTAVSNAVSQCLLSFDDENQE